jgi:hypothetical protein
VQIRDVLRDAGGAIERRHVGDELDGVAGDEARREAQVAQELDGQPGEVAAGAVAALERLVGGKHARLHAHVVAEAPLQILIDGDEDVDAARVAAGVPHARLFHERRQPRAGGEALEVGGELHRQGGLVAEGVALGGGVDEEVERIHHHHLGHQVHLHRQLLGGAVEHHPGLVVAEGVLLPVEEVIARADPERVAQDRGPTVRRGPQPDDVRLEADRPIVVITSLMIEGDTDGHEHLPDVTLGPTGESLISARLIRREFDS